MFRYVILGLLRSGRVLHGYCLMKEHQARSGILVNSGNFSRELRRLAGQGLVTAAAHRVGTDPSRVPYEITAAGAMEFDAWLESEIRSGNERRADEPSARALFIDEAGETVILGAMEHWRRQLSVHIERLDSVRQSAVQQAKEQPPERFAALSHLLARRLKHLAADLEFIEEMRGAVRDWARHRGRSRTATPGSSRARSKRRRAATPVE